MATHRLAHKRCSQCGFEAIAKVLAMHMDEAHAPKYAQVSGTLDSPEEIAAWVAARKQAYPKEDSKQIDESPKTTKGKCKFFSKGTCKKGSNCSFSHEGMTAPFSLQNTPKQEPVYSV